DEEYLRHVPVLPVTRGYQTVLQQAPGVTGTGNPNVFGGNAMENTWLVDGVNATDSVTHTFSLNLNYDAVQEINFQTSSFDAEYGRASGGVINVITKSGGNEFHGSLDARYTSEKFAESGDHFDADIAPNESFPISGTFGGPIIRDRLWFFLNTQRLDSFTTPVVTNPVVLAQNPNPPRGEFEGWSSGGKLSFTVIPQLTGFFSVLDAFADLPLSSTTRRPEAQGLQEQDSRVYSLKLDSVVTSDWLVNLQAGRHESNVTTGPISGNLEISQWTNIGGGSVVYDNYNNFQNTDRNRDLIGVSTTYYVGNLAGSHEFKVGADADQTEAPSINFTTGSPSDPSFCPPGLTCGATFTFRFDANGNRTPVQQVVSQRSDPFLRTGESFSVYGQDQWRIIPQLTLKLGVRYDRNEYFDENDDSVITFDKVQPRVGVVWDIAADSKTVVRANYGLFYVDAALTLNRLFDVGVTSFSRVFNWSATQGRWIGNNPTGGTPIEAALIDRPLDPTYDEQVNVAVERQLWKNAAASVTYVYKKTNDIYEDSCLDADCSNFWITNQPGAFLGQEDVLRKDYYGYIFEFEQRLSRGQAAVNYAYSKSRGSIDSSEGQFAGVDFDEFPDHFVNRYGFLPDDARHRFRVFGAYMLPYIDTWLSANYFFRTGLPYTVTLPSQFGGTVFQEPRGSSRTEDLHQLDMGLEKQFDLFGSLSVSVIGQVRNVLDREAATTYFTNAASPGTVRTPSAYQQPRNYQVGFRIDF
ncbi:MAG TPA: TonB-dependent receptor, partial [Thermoanaerobaculia bacterium]|nr:TonB-dependent receptor [Thermoanaerobaculia bacterium]